LEPIRSSSISLPASLDVQPKNEVSDASWNPLDPAVINQPAGLAWDRRTAQLGVAAAAAGVVTVVVLLFVIMKPAPRQSDAGSTSSEITGSTRTALPQSVQADVGSKPALAEFQAFLSSVPPSQPATQEQSQQLLQQFLQWRKKANTTQTTNSGPTNTAGRSRHRRQRKEQTYRVESGPAEGESMTAVGGRLFAFLGRTCARARAFRSTSQARNCLNSASFSASDSSFVAAAAGAAAART
jgi:uncharacterized protein YeaC (DUF1315 family)